MTSCTGGDQGKLERAQERRNWEQVHPAQTQTSQEQQAHDDAEAATTTVLMEGGPTRGYPGLEEAHM